jgi:hypothetical protein
MKRFLPMLGVLALIVACGNPSPTSAGPAKNKSHLKTCPDGTQVRANVKCPVSTPPAPEPPPPPPTPPSFSVGDVTVNEDAGTATVHITKTNANGLSSVISYGTAAGTASSENGDFTAVSGTITVADATTDITITVPITDDTTVEGNETFGVSITGDTNATVIRRTGTVTIIDNDVAAPLPSPSFSVQDAMVNEGAGTVTIHILKTNANGSSSTIAYAAADGTAGSSDYTATSGSLTFADGETDKTVTVSITNDSSVETSETFSLNITASDNAVAARNGTVTIMDDDQNPVTPGYVPSPSLDGVVPIQTTDFDRTTAITAFPPAPLNSQDTLGAFRFVCAPGQLLYDDPIVYPGQPGRSHLHQFYGNLAANANSNYQTLRTTGGSSCNQTGSATAVNRSAYWMPAMLDGRGHVIQPDYIVIYYKRYPKSSSECSTGTRGIACLPVPNGLRFIMGRDMLNLSAAPTGNFHFLCDNDTGSWPTLPEALSRCVAGKHLVAVIDAPTCWDGKYIDTPDHRSHVSYMVDSHMGYPKCPDTHPYIIPQFILSVYYSVVANEDTSTWQFSSDAMAPNEPHGSTYHADFWMAWDPPTRDTWEANCLNLKLNCSSGDMGNQTGVLGAYQPSWGFNTNPNRLVAVP